MIYTFPKCIFTEINSAEQQFEHIRSEFTESVKAEGAGERDCELMDLLHSIESYFRIREAQGIDVTLTKANTVYKNAQRSYYEDSELQRWIAQPK